MAHVHITYMTQTDENNWIHSQLLLCSLNWSVSPSAAQMSQLEKWTADASAIFMIVPIWMHLFMENHESLSI